MSLRLDARWLRRAYYVAGTAAGMLVLYLLASRLGEDVDAGILLQVLPVSLLAISCFALPLAAATESWRLLFPRDRAPPFPFSALLTWIGLSVNWLLPAALVGGELVKLRLAVPRVPSTEALAASLVGDKTIQVVTQLLFTLLGLAVLAAADERFTGGAAEAAALGLFSLAVYLFYRLQRAGLAAWTAAGLEKLMRREQALAPKARRIDAAIDGLYRRSGRWWRAAAWRMGFRLLMALEVAVVLWWLEAPLSLGAVIALESLAQASRVAALVLPAALGAQEAVIVAAGLALGYPVDALFALAVVKRLRELVVGGAGLVAWQIIEGRKLRAD